MCGQLRPTTLANFSSSQHSSVEIWSPQDPCSKVKISHGRRSSAFGDVRIAFGTNAFSEDAGRKEETRVSSAVAERTGEAGPTGERSPTPLEMLAESGAAVAAEEAARSSSRESPGISVATEILDSDDESSSEGQESESVKGTPTGVLCEQVVPLLRYLDRKTAKYADPRHRRSYVELKLQKEVNQLREYKASEAPREFEKQWEEIKAELNSEQAQNCILAEELVRQTRLLEQCQIARRAEEELLRRLQSQCDELRAQRAEAELQFVDLEGDKRRASDRTREELVARVNHCLRGYTHWEVAAQERITLRELELRAAALMSGDSRGQRRVAKRLDAFLSRSQDAITSLESEVTAVLWRLGLRSRAEDWSGRQLVRSRPSHQRHSR
ncbi:hypothetical protein AXG93_725s1510 [Marchantia polymorpha subsp. ruderalis]|uniref:Uncharacterized protein n=1 Tax=Marchantia polymorpha subsp. ruderalis TaxID=1480154 RepID=A0A176WFS8_MARPO|nr:hypothetical protein AXG93_725s1510 [Marchantia polymorpha subsp. ruderalis]